MEVPVLLSFATKSTTFFTMRATHLAKWTKSDVFHYSYIACGGMVDHSDYLLNRKISRVPQLASSCANPPWLISSILETFLSMRLYCISYKIFHASWKLLQMIFKFDLRSPDPIEASSRIYKMPDKINPKISLTWLYQLCCSYTVFSPIAKILRRLKLCEAACTSINHLFLFPNNRRPANLFVFSSKGDQVRLQVHNISQDPGLPCQKPTTSFWQQGPPHPDLVTTQSVDLPVQTDVLIIGSGITAASVSHHLLTSNDKMSVLVAEARTITSGGTGRNGGHIVEVPYEDYDFQVSLMGRTATKDVIQFRLDHLPELVEMSKTQMTEKAADQSEIRVIEVADAAFDQIQWNKVKAQLASFLEDFPEQRTKWKVLEKDEARKVNTSKSPHTKPSDTSVF